jgi:hypothetical protein
MRDSSKQNVIRFIQAFGLGAWIVFGVTLLFNSFFTDIRYIGWWFNNPISTERIGFSVFVGFFVGLLFFKQAKKTIEEQGLFEAYYVEHKKKQEELGRSLTAEEASVLEREVRKRMSTEVRCSDHSVPKGSEEYASHYPYKKKEL